MPKRLRHSGEYRCRATHRLHIEERREASLVLAAETWEEEVTGMSVLDTIILGMLLLFVLSWIVSTAYVFGKYRGAMEAIDELQRLDALMKDGEKK